jgi:hypothetical protein
VGLNQALGVEGIEIVVVTEAQRFENGFSPLERFGIRQAGGPGFLIIEVDGLLGEHHDVTELRLAIFQQVLPQRRESHRRDHGHTGHGQQHHHQQLGGNLQARAHGAPAFQGFGWGASALAGIDKNAPNRPHNRPRGMASAHVFDPTGAGRAGPLRHHALI